MFDLLNWFSILNSPFLIIYLFFGISIIFELSVFLKSSILDFRDNFWIFIYAELQFQIRISLLII